MTKPCIFLDVDGVLNSEQSFIEANRASNLEHLSYLVAPDLLDHFVHLWQRALYPDVVLSSTWRLLLPSRHIVRSVLWSRRIPILDTTLNMPDEPRGEEVKAWLREHGDRPHVILDDDSDFAEDQPLVQTDFRRGLQLEHVERALAILEGREIA